MSDLKAIIEALIYASPEPVTLKALTKLLDSEPKEDVAAALEALKADYQRPGGLQVVDVAGGFQIVDEELAGLDHFVLAEGALLDFGRDGDGFGVALVVDPGDPDGEDADGDEDEEG